jgi:hypothetical protein
MVGGDQLFDVDRADGGLLAVDEAELGLEKGLEWLVGRGLFGDVEEGRLGGEHGERIAQVIEIVKYFNITSTLYYGH